MSSVSNSTGPAGAAANNEEALRQQLRSAFSTLASREPLDPTYRRLLLNGLVTARRPVLLKDKFYKRAIQSRLRQRVETFLAKTEGKDPFDVISQRRPLEEGAMRAAFTLREEKEHEQQALLKATVEALPKRNGMDDRTRRRYLEGIAQGLQSREKPSAKLAQQSAPPGPTASAAQQTEYAMQQAELERQKQEARARELARQKRQDEERQRREDEIGRQRQPGPSPQHALYKLYYPIFKKLWDMEFPLLGGINPFRIVIDRDNCASVGAPDYFDVIDTPMNLTYIQEKVNNQSYETLAAFCADVELMIENAIKYNSDQANPYRIAAEDMKKRYKKIARKVLSSIKM